MIDNASFLIDHTARLNGAAIKHADIPRNLDENGNQRLDCWVFILEKDEDAELFTVGEVVLLESAIEEE
ncbi:MAG: hypothetical protein AAFY15_05520 [Cyanobacteria bacterium J06648_11]